MVAHISQVFSKRSQILGRCLVEMVVLPRSIASLCKAYPGFCSLNWVVGNDRSWVLILKFRQKFKFGFDENMTLLINRGNKIFQLPGLIFSRTLSISKQKLPETSPLWR